MEQTASAKKLMLAAILTSGLALAFTQSATARPAQDGAVGKKPMMPCTTMPCKGQMNSVIQKTKEQFLNDTREIRKQLVQKKIVLKALMKAGTPDTVKASQLAGEIFDLREQLRLKAQETGLPLHTLMGGYGWHTGMDYNSDGYHGYHQNNKGYRRN